jgi:5'-nucleotidase
VGDPLKGKLVVGISSRALFDLDAANEIYVRDGLTAYRAFQREHEHDILEPGTGFPLVKGLLAVNQRLPDQEPVEVIVLSRNDADSAMRVFNSIEAHGLPITRGAFRGGRDPWPFLQPFRCGLFLSAEPEDVVQALGQGIPAALVLHPPEPGTDDDDNEVRIAFDGDAVLFGDESERIFQRDGLQAFQRHEAERAEEPMEPGPFRPFLEGLARIQALFSPNEPPIRTALVTARNAPAHRRVVHTLRAWNVRVDETFFLGGMEKDEILARFRPHIFFDDQMTHLERAANRVPSAHVPPRGEQLDLFPPASPPPKEGRSSRRRTARGGTTGLHVIPVATKARPAPKRSRGAVPTPEEREAPRASVPSEAPTTRVPG